MEKFVNFVTHHWILSSLLVLVGVLWAIQEWLQGRGTSQVISVDQLIQWMNRGSVELLDIRSPSEFASGHILHAESISAENWKQKLDQGKFKKPCVLVCGNGRMSQQWVTQVRGKHIVYTLQGGMSSWRAASMPLEKA